MCDAAGFEKLKVKLWNFMTEEIYPNERKFEEQSRAFEHTNEWTHPPILIELIQKAKKVPVCYPTPRLSGRDSLRFC